MRIGFLGAFSIDNAGDLLVARATRQAIRARIACEEVVLAPDLGAPGWRHDWSATRGDGVPIRRVPPFLAAQCTADLDALIIGGGGILLPYAGFQPVVAWGSVPAAWNAVSSQNTRAGEAPHEQWYARVRAGCERLRYASVRDAPTERLLRACGVTRPIARVPDPALGYVPDSDAATDARLDALLGRSPASSSHSVTHASSSSSRPLVGVSIGNAIALPAWAAFFEALFADLERRASSGEIDVVVFGFGRVYGDDEIARTAASRMPHARLLVPRTAPVAHPPDPSDARPPDVLLSPDALWRLIGKLDAYVCTRFHAMIAAHAQGVPFLAIDEYTDPLSATSKIREFLVERTIEDARIAPTIAHAAPTDAATSIGARIEALLGRPRAMPSTLAADRAALDAHYDAMLTALTGIDRVTVR